MVSGNLSTDGGQMSIPVGEKVAKTYTLCRPSVYIGYSNLSTNVLKMGSVNHLLISRDNLSDVARNLNAYIDNNR